MGVQRLRRVLTEPAVVRVEGVPRHVSGVRQAVGVGGVLVGVPRRLVGSDGGAHCVRSHGGGAGVLVLGVVVPEEGLGVHTHSAPAQQTLTTCDRSQSSQMSVIKVVECLLPGPVRQGRVVGWVGGHVVRPVGGDG